MIDFNRFDKQIRNANADIETGSVTTMAMSLKSLINCIETIRAEYKTEIKQISAPAIENQNLEIMVQVLLQDVRSGYLTNYGIIKRLDDIVLEVQTNG